MTVDASWTGLRGEVLQTLMPSEAEERALGELRGRLEGELTRRLDEAGLRAVAEVHGSAARGTWIAGDRDIDLFIVLDGSYGRDVLPGVLDVVKAYVGEGWVEAYAEHPYIKAKVDGYDVDFVPCFRVDPGQGLTSATDRTPLHTAYVMENLEEGARDEVRLLKRFMKGVGVYGADLKVGGFSGYLCELLVIRFGSFEGVLGGAADWGHGAVFMLEGAPDIGALRKRFPEPLVVVDPVDAKRNVASAVSETSFWTFVAASRDFLRQPTIRFFYPPEVHVDAGGLLEMIGGRGSDLLFVVVDDDEVEVPDVLWGQLNRTERAVTGFLEKAGFDVFRSASWSDESTRHVLVIELASAVIPGVMGRRGPPVALAEDGVRFVNVHLEAEDTVSGPWIAGDHWWVAKRRAEPDARRLLAAMLEEGGLGVGVSKGLKEKMRHSGRVLLNEEVGGFLERGFEGFLAGFLRGRPVWIE
ncbi:CCA tRNA nucleotidyltransferase [Candidatus Bathyarchaeota archaeon]|nr:CCA tRNA nucleotidyltransferase [Candidatus Bathyarchaeota archaeon]